MPDLSLAGYVFSPLAGTVAYTMVHTYAVPLLLAVISGVADQSIGLQRSLIWLAHLGVDRALGFGLTCPTDARQSHVYRSKEDVFQANLRSDYHMIA